MIGEVDLLASATDLVVSHEIERIVEARGVTFPQHHTREIAANQRLRLVVGRGKLLTQLVCIQTGQPKHRRQQVGVTGQHIRR